LNVITIPACPFTAVSSTKSSPASGKAGRHRYEMPNGLDHDRKRVEQNLDVDRRETCCLKMLGTSEDRLVLEH